MQNEGYKIGESVKDLDGETYWVRGGAPNAKGNWVYAVSKSFNGKCLFFDESQLELTR